MLALLLGAAFAQSTPLLPVAVAPRTDPCDWERLAVTLPDPAAAATLSGFVGFGAGHFYARQSLPGALFAVGQVGGLGLAAGGALADQPDAALAIGGAVLFTLIRVADIASAPGSARATSLTMLDDCGW